MLISVVMGERKPRCIQVLGVGCLAVSDTGVHCGTLAQLYLDNRRASPGLSRSGGPQSWACAGLNTSSVEGESGCQRGAGGPGAEPLKAPLVHRAGRTCIFEWPKFQVHPQAQNGT